MRVWANSTIALFTVDCRPFQPGVSVDVIQERLGLRDAWAPGHCEGVVVGIVDSGIDGTEYPVAGGFNRAFGQAPGAAAIDSHGSMCAADVLVAAPEAKLHDYPFLAEQRRLDHWMMRATRMGGADVEPPTEGWFLPLERLLNDVQVFGGRDAALAARRLYAATIKLDEGTIGVMQAVDEALENYRRALQVDLGMKPTALPEWRGDEAL